MTDSRSSSASPEEDSVRSRTSFTAAGSSQNDSGSSPQSDQIALSNPPSTPFPSTPNNTPCYPPPDDAFANSQLDNRSLEEDFNTYFDDEQILIPEDENVSIAISLVFT